MSYNLMYCMIVMQFLAVAAASVLSLLRLKIINFHLVYSNRVECGLVIYDKLPERSARSYVTSVLCGVVH